MARRVKTSHPGRSGGAAQSRDLRATKCLSVARRTCTARTAFTCGLHPGAAGSELGLAIIVRPVDAAPHACGKGRHVEGRWLGTMSDRNRPEAVVLLGPSAPANFSWVGVTESSVSGRSVYKRLSCCELALPVRR